MYHISSLFVPGGGSGGPSKEDGLKTGIGSGGGKHLEFSGGKGIEMAANSGCGSGGSSEFDGLRRSGSGSGGDGPGSDSGGGAGGVIFLKSARVGEGAIGSHGCRSGAGPSNVVEEVFYNAYLPYLTSKSPQKDTVVKKRCCRKRMTDSN